LILVVIRHGRTSWNAAGRFQGQTDIALDDIGEDQAQGLAAEVAGMRPALVLSSDLARATATAAPLVAATGAVLELDAALREIYLGAWEGLDRAQAAVRFPEEYREWSAGRPVRRGGGETEEEAGRRSAGYIIDTMQRTSASTVAVVAHGIVLRAALSDLAGAGHIDLDGAAPHLENAAWRVYDYQR
jgi:glucosyl-3-phosphoglycerate phosphatase